MTYLLKDIRDELLEDTDIQNAVGEHIYPDVIPQDVEWNDAIVLSELTVVPEYYLGGEAGLHTTNVQVDVWCAGRGRRNRVNEVAELVRNRLSGYRGQFGSGCYGTARIIRSDVVATLPIDASDRHKWRASMDFEIIHTADTPTLS